MVAVSLPDRLKEHVAENGTGMIHDLVFAIVWVTAVTVLFDFVFTSAPAWAFYMFLLAGIPAYFGFFWSLESAKRSQ